MLKIETDTTPQGAAQVLTRLQAFFEGMEAPAPTRIATAPRTRNGKEYYAGIDSGSTTTNAVILDGDRAIVSFCTLPTGVQVAESANRALEAALDRAGLEQAQIRHTVSTGYGRAYIAFRERDVTESTCHARGAHFLDPAVRTVIDVGGQESKVIRLDERGGVRSFVMNDKCSAGNRGVVPAIEERLGCKLLLPAEPELCGALGAALIAMEGGDA
jgi:activator of 2-hydroxyglutaryl-CoA dehydratase